jgi:ATP-dependent DNA helicase RecG
MMINTIKITEQQYQELLQLNESHFLDLKGIDIKPANATKTISAFANASGGDIYFGIEEIDRNSEKKRIWRGFNDEESANSLIQSIENLSPLANHYSATFLSTNQAPGLVLQVTIFKSKDIIYSSDRTVYVRKNAQKQKIEGDEALQRLRLDKGVVSFEDEVVECELNEVTNSEMVIKFMLSVIPSFEPEFWLKKQRLISNDRVTVAGAMLFSDEPQSLLPKRSAIKLYRYKTRSEEGERDFLDFDPITIEGSAYAIIYNCVNQCKKIVEGVEKLGPEGLERVNYPEEALHEIITNAVLHRDYSLASDIHVRIFDNRIEIESPGKLPGYITLDNILNEQFARNPKIVRIINKFPNPPNKDVGEGLNTAYEAMEKLRLKPPLIEEKENSVLVVLKHEGLGSPEQIVMAYLDNHGDITNSIARQLTGIKSENVMKDVFYRLRDRGSIELVTENKGRSSSWRKC